MIFADSTAIVSNFSSALNIILLITAVSMGALNIRNKYEKGRDEESKKNLEDAVSTYKTRRDADQILLDAKDAEIKLLHQKAEILESHVTQAPDITKLIAQLTKQHKETTESNKSIIEGLGNVAKELGNLAKSLNKEDNA